MKKTVFAVVYLSLLALLAACQTKTKELNLYTWADYIKPELVEQFEKDNNCKVIIDTFDSNESMYAKIKAGATGYDVVTPSSYMVQLMLAQDMLTKFDKSKLPNLKNIDPEYLKVALDSRLEYSAPYMITYVGIGYLADKVSGFDPSWSIFDQPALKGRMTMLNDMRETIGAALKFLGYSLNTTNPKELEQAKEVVIRWKKNLAKFENEQYKLGLASGEFLVTHGYSGDILKLKEENPNIEFALPKEGFSLASDDLVILKTADEVDLAHKFINYLHEPAVAAANTEFITYLCPNQASYALLNETAKADPVLFPPLEIRKKGEVIKDLGKDNQLYTKIWDQIKAAE